MTCKMSNRWRNAWMAIVAVFFTVTGTGCLKDDLAGCPEDYELYVKVVDLVTGADLTTSGEVESVNLYIFGGDGCFTEQVTLSADDIRQRLPVIIKRSKAESLRIYAWGNLSGSEQVPDPVEGNLPESLQILLKTNDEGYAQCPGDLFFGEKTIALDLQSRIQRAEIPVARKNAHLTITVRGLGAIANEADYYFIVDKAYNGYDLAGKPLRSSAVIRQEGRINQENNDFATPEAFSVIHHAEGGEGIRISLCNSTTGETITTVSHTADGSLIAPLAGQTTNVFIDLGGSTSVKIEITPWDEVFQWETW